MEESIQAQKTECAKALWWEVMQFVSETENAGVAEVQSTVTHGMAFAKSSGAKEAKECHWNILRIFIGSDKI